MMVLARIVCRDRIGQGIGVKQHDREVIEELLGLLVLGRALREPDLAGVEDVYVDNKTSSGRRGKGVIVDISDRGTTGVKQLVATRVDYRVENLILEISILQFVTQNVGF